MSTSPTFVIVGAGLAGAKAAETLRAEGFDGRLLLLGAEAERPYDHPPLSQTYLRVEHWANARNQGPAAARNMLGVPTPYARLPYFYSDQYDLSMEYSGFAATWDRVVVRGDPAARQFIAFWLKDRRVVAGMSANVWDVTEPIQILIRGGLAVEPARLADPAIPLDQVTGAPATRSTR
jgi:3-phenylpropionate/trans-cinnamate dioxygenase ferredoxin reductase component